MGKRLNKIVLSPIRMAIMLHLFELGESTISEIIEKEPAIGVGGVETRTYFKKLLAGGLIKVEGSKTAPGDQRRNIYALTDLGRAVLTDKLPLITDTLKKLEARGRLKYHHAPRTSHLTILLREINHSLLQVE